MANLFEVVSNTFSPKLIKTLQEPFKTPDTTKRTTEFGDSDIVRDVDIISSDNVGNYFTQSFNLKEQLNTVDDLIKLYESISQLAIPNDAILEITNEAIIRNEKEPITLDFNDPQDAIDGNLRNTIVDEFKFLLDLINFDDDGPDLFRQWYVQGRLLIQIILDKDNTEKGIIGTKIMSPLSLKRYYDEEDKKHYYVYDKNKQGNNPLNDEVHRIPDELVVFVPSGLYISEKKIPVSYLHTAIKTIQRLDILEDHILIYRIVRAPERRVFYVDPGNLPAKKAEAYLQKIISKYKQKHIWDEKSGTLSTKVKHPAMIEDFFLLRRGGKNTEITTLPGGQALGEIGDLVYFKRDAVRALHVPFTRLNEEDRKDSVPTTAEITREEVKFYSYFTMLQNKFSFLFKELLHKQLVYKKLISEDQWNSLRRKLVFKFKTNTHHLEMMKLQNLEIRLSAYRDASDLRDKGFISNQWIWKNILNFTDADIKKVKEELLTENTDLEE